MQEKKTIHNSGVPLLCAAIIENAMNEYVNEALRKHRMIVNADKEKARVRRSFIKEKKGYCKALRTKRTKRFMQQASRAVKPIPAKHCKFRTFIPIVIPDEVIEYEFACRLKMCDSKMKEVERFIYSEWYMMLCNIEASKMMDYIIGLAEKSIKAYDKKHRL